MYLLVGKRTGNVYRAGAHRAACLRWLHAEYPDDGKFKGKVLPEPMAIKKAPYGSRAHENRNISLV